MLETCYGVMDFVLNWLLKWYMHVYVIVVIVKGYITVSVVRV